MPKLTNWNPSSNSWFLGIGIDSYQSFDKLSNAVKGVQEVQDVLLNNYDLDEDCVVTLYDNEATKENIIDTLDELGQKIEPGDKLMIYYSGHGHLNNSLGLGYWIPIDAKKGKASSYLPNSTVRDYVKGIKAKHILLISDSCFSGSLFMQGAFRTSRAVKELDGLNSRWAICSGRHDEEVYDGMPGENSPFTQSFIDYLNANEKESVNVARVADHVIEQTAANYEQLPDGRPMFGVGHQGGQYIFWKKGAVTQTSSSSKRSNVTVESQSVPLLPPPNKLINNGQILKLIGGVAILALGFWIGISHMNNSELIESSDSSQIMLIGDGGSLNETSEKEVKTPVSKQPISDKQITNRQVSAQKATPTLSEQENVVSKSETILVSDIDDAVIELYELESYKGRMFPLYGENNSKIDNFDRIEVQGLEFNDVISSITISIPEGYEFVLYENKRQKGESISLSGNGMKQYFPNIGSLLGKVSSCELRKKK